MNKQETITLLEDLLETFQTKGWQSFHEDMQIKCSALKEGAFNECTTNDSWHYRRGVVDTLSFILSYQSQIESEYERVTTEETTESYDEASEEF